MERCRLYFCRPFSRAEYVLGKASVLSDFAFADHLDSRPGFIRSASKPGWSVLDLEPSLDRGQPAAFFLDLDRDAVAARHGAVGVGDVENCCGRAVAWQFYFSEPALHKLSML